jgi:hypothetical protein
VVPGAVGHNDPEDHSGLRKKAADKKADNAADGCDGHHILVDCRSGPLSLPPPTLSERCHRCLAPLNPFLIAPLMVRGIVGLP